MNANGSPENTEWAFGRTQDLSVVDYQPWQAAIGGRNPRNAVGRFMSLHIISEDIYFDVVNAKTASLFSAACQVGSISANASNTEINALKSFGTNFGMTFQLVDDAIDYSSNKKILGKNTGDDFKEGKITLPIILAYGRSNEKEKKFWKRTISELNQEEGDFDNALDIINKYQCIQDTITRANHFSNVAIDSIDIFKNNIFKEKLAALVSTSISRIY